MNIIFNALGFFQNSLQKEHMLKENNNDTSQPDLNLPTKKQLLEKRGQVIGNKCEIFYKKNPIVVSQAKMQYIYDETGHKYLDCISNVQHVGHCHPLVVKRITEQMLQSNCNIRFVSSKLTECAEAILSTLPSKLNTVLFCNSGSEANDLALRLARDFTGNKDVIVLDHAYHGHLISTMQISPYKFNHGSNVPKPEYVHVAPTPDPYRGKHRLSDDQLHQEDACAANSRLYVHEISELIDREIKSKGGSIAAYIAEALQSCGGQILPDRSYFAQVAREVRSAGGLMIIDEVQTGFGRVGSNYWAFELSDDFVPDIVTIGKPIGNGFPVACVVTTKEIANKLGGSISYFNTYGGNPVSCTAVLAVLEVLKCERLLEHAQQMNERFKRELCELQAKHECVGDVRGVGMFWGIDLVTDRQTRTPATQLALDLCLLLREEYGVLLNADGPHSNILKYKPPMCFNQEDLTTSVCAIDAALTRLTK